MKSILIICNMLGTGGAEKQTVELANGLYERGWKVVLVYLTPIDDQLKYINKELRKNVMLVTRKSYIDFNAAQSIKKVIDSNSIDKILSVNQMSLIYAVIARGFNFRIKLFAGFHTTKLARRELLKFYFTAWIPFKMASKVVYVCRNQMEYWSKRLLHLKGRSIYIYNGVNTNEFTVDEESNRKQYRSELNLHENAFVLVSVARLRPEKRHIDMLHIIKRLRDDGVDAFLICVGDGPEMDNIVTTASRLGVSPYIKMIGRVDNVKRYIASADALLLLSKAVETFSIAVLEALSSGCPVVAYDIGGIREQITSDMYGHVISLGDEEGVIVALKSVYNQREKINKMAIHEYIVSTFSSKKMLDDYEALFLGDV